MCRWFAYISPDEPCLLADVLINPPHGLVNQVSSHYLPYLTEHKLADDMVDDLAQGDSEKPSKHLAPDTTTKELTAEQKRQQNVKLRNLMLNDDGAGLAAFTPSSSIFTSPETSHHVLHPLVYKSVAPFKNDINFLSLAENLETTCLMAHVRARDAGAPVATLNVHPFVYGRWAIMHNGAVANFGSIRRELLNSLSHDVYAEVKGGTDSEVVGALIVDKLTDGKGKKAWQIEHSATDVLAAVEATYKHIIEVQRKADPSGSQTEPNSLNVCVSDGTKLVATRFRNAEDQPPSLYWSTTAGVTLNRMFPGHPKKEVHEQLKGKETDVKSPEEHGQHVIVASEPTTFIEEDWKLLPKNTALVVDIKGHLNTKELGPY